MPFHEIMLLELIISSGRYFRTHICCINMLCWYLILHNNDTGTDNNPDTTTVINNYLYLYSTFKELQDASQIISNS